MSELRNHFLIPLFIQFQILIPMVEVDFKILKLVRAIQFQIFETDFNHQFQNLKPNT